MRDTPPTCREVAATVGDLADGRLDLPRRRGLERHVAGCRGCAVHLDQVRTTIRACRLLSEVPRAPAPSEALLRAFRGAGG